MRPSNINCPILSALGAAVATLILFIILSNLSKIERRPGPVDHPPPVSINYTPPVKPPEPVQLEETSPTLLEQVKTVVPNENPVKTETPHPRIFTEIASPEGITIPNARTFTDMKFPVVSEIFKPFQVDRKPYILRLVNPIYPFAAKSSGIEGRVVLRFVVDEKGLVHNPEVINAEPVGVFEKSALAAIVKYRFKPAAIGNEPVKCIVVMPMGFELK